MTFNKTFAWFCISLVACIENDVNLHDVDINKMFLDLKNLALGVMINVSFISETHGSLYIFCRVQETIPKSKFYTVQHTVGLRGLVNRL